MKPTAAALRAIDFDLPDTRDNRIAAVEAEIRPLLELLESCRDRIGDEQLWDEIDGAIKHARGTP